MLCFFFLFSLFLAALSIYCSTQALPLSSCGKKGLILVVVHGFLIEVAFFVAGGSLVVEHRL